MRRSAVIILAIIFVILGFYLRDQSFFEQPRIETPVTGGAVSNAYRQKQSNIQVKGSGTVVAVLKDDNTGTRHQRFILKLADGITILVAHNIDLSKRIDGLEKGDNVEFFGEYEYNDKGGVVHWTHRDPAGRHTDGWLRHEDRMYR